MELTVIQQKKASLMAELKVVLDEFIKKYDFTGPISAGKSIQERAREIINDLPDELIEFTVIPLHEDWTFYKEHVRK